MAFRPFHRLAPLALLAAAALFSACASGPVRPNITVSDVAFLRLTDLDAQPALLGQAAHENGTGRVRLVHFFATWCFPCLAETPSLNVLSQKLSGQGLDVVAIGMDLEGETVLAPFVEMNGLTFPVLIPSDDLREGRSPFGLIQALPTTFLFARDGRLAEVWEGPAEPARLEALVERLLAEKP